MSDTEPQNQAAQGQSLAVNGQYIKDLSFEVPNAPAIYGELRGQPEIPIGIDIDATKLNEGVYEVVLRITVDATANGKKAFILELAYGGVFTLQNIPAEHVQPVLLIECPRLLFPFARNIIAEMTRDGGFPPLMMQPVDFMALYRQRMEQAQAAQQDSGQATA